MIADLHLLRLEVDLWKKAGHGTRHGWQSTPIAHAAGRWHPGVKADAPRCPYCGVAFRQPPHTKVRSCAAFQYMRRCRLCSTIFLIEVGAPHSSVVAQVSDSWYWVRLTNTYWRRR